MCSRGLRFFFRTRNQVSNRKNRYRLTANHFEAALYVGDPDRPPPPLWRMPRGAADARDE